MVPSLLVYDVEQCVGVMHNEIEPRLPFYLAANFEWFYSRRYPPYQYLAIFTVYYRPPGFTTSHSPLSARCFRRARFCMKTLLSTGTLASIFSTRKTWRRSPHYSSSARQLQQTCRALSLAPAWRDLSRPWHRRTDISARLLASILSPPSSMATCTFCSYSK